MKDAYAELGIGICAISRDTREILSKFATKKNITFPLLADPDYRVISAFGIINHGIPRDNKNYGIANPVQYIVNPDGVVREKVFAENYWERVTQESVLARYYGWDPGTGTGRFESGQLVVEYRASQETVRAGNHITLILDVKLKEKMHVYAPGAEDYIPLSWELKPSKYYKGLEPEFPKSEVLYLEALDEKLPVYTGEFRIVQDVVIGTQKALRASDEEGAPLVDKLVIEGVFGYQACDDVKCFIPQETTLKFELKVGRHDWDRIVKPPQAKKK